MANTLEYPIPTYRMVDTLGNGIPKRSLGWKLGNFSDFMEGRIPQHRNIKRWDGAARTCTAWDRLRRDPELWYRDGNCSVHLYGKGHSRRGPTFKVPLGRLLEAKCQPLLSRYLFRDLQESDTCTGELMHVDNDLPTSEVELYIPPPPMADRDPEQAFQFRLAIRNFFAWVYRRSMVGEHLGSALIEVMNNMAEFRSPGVNAAEDMMSYLDEEGYMDMANNPDYALAMLHLAENFQMRDLYIDAFAHCAGMSEHLHACDEFLTISTTTRKLIRSARADMDARLGEAGLVLSNFLAGELSASSLILSIAGKVHLQRFRAFLLAFYTASLGHYPPEPVDTKGTVWNAEAYRRMRADFEGLYQYLADETFTMAGSSPFLAERGITVLHSVKAFDIRHSYTSLRHPLPLLPRITAPPSSGKRKFWSSRRDKTLPDPRLVAHAALIKASNKEKTHLSQNHLVTAYKRFEEDSVYTRKKLDRKEQRLSLADGRKIRWILIYGILQILRSCTDVPPEVRDTATGSYNLAVSTAQLPPWEKAHQPSSFRRRSLLSPLTTSPRLPLSRVASAALSCRSTPALMALASRRDTDSPDPSPNFRPVSRRTMPSIPASPSKRISRTGWLMSRLSRLSWPKRSSSPSPATSPSPGTCPSPTPPSSRTSARQPVYHEIVIHGYGNGTNDVSATTIYPDKTTTTEPTTPHRPGITPPPYCSIQSSSSTTTPLTEYSPRGSTCRGDTTLFSISSPISTSISSSSSACPSVYASFPSSLSSSNNLADDEDANNPPATPTPLTPPPAPKGSPVILPSASSSVYSTDEGNPPGHLVAPSPPLSLSRSPLISLSPSPSLLSLISLSAPLSPPSSPSCSPPPLPRRNSARGSVVVGLSSPAAGYRQGGSWLADADTEGEVELRPSPLRIKKEGGSVLVVGVED